jgi:hypothetical protein
MKFPGRCVSPVRALSRATSDRTELSAGETASDLTKTGYDLPSNEGSTKKKGRGSPGPSSLTCPCLPLRVLRVALLGDELLLVRERPLCPDDGHLAERAGLDLDRNVVCVPGEDRPLLLPANEHRGDELEV